MLKEKAREVGILVAIADLTLLALAFVLACQFRFQFIARLLDEPAGLRLRPYAWILYLSAPLLLYLFRQSGLYGSLRSKGYAEVLWLTFKPFIVAFALMGLSIFLLQDKDFSRPIFLSFFVIGFSLVAAEKQVIKWVAMNARKRGYNTRNVLIVGANVDSVEVARLLESTPEYGYTVIGLLVGVDDLLVQTGEFPVLGHVRDLQTFLDEQPVDDVIFSVPYAQLPAYDHALHLCEEVGLKIHLKIDPVATLLSRTYASQVGAFPILTLASTPHDPIEILAKRLIDVGVTLFALIPVLPVMGVAALAIRLTSSGPVLFRQVRSGLNGRQFMLYKFRSMYAGAEERQQELVDSNEMTGPVFKMKRDPRVTPVGRFIRKWSIDELPQLFNVLKGDMSLVGPRPPIPAEVVNYKRWQKRRLSVKPGVTCLWQVAGRNSIDFDDWMRLDMEYIDNWSLALDIKILARTIPAVLFARGAR